ncbi:MAG: hypothetical protein CO020_00290 [Candidatus Colwellbacteria bacterium CG_4_9_14_0_2_um_filter_50_12]|uniref:Uncharacterized protein n=1 Tax=Candidatus Colwellbacteria bacterium CG_4_9_14_0_2_um_filter_50_12 TaxID=1974538 RepID=A0A2M8G1H1_9BACT|nr:MAG: hypothetical protein CO020_00290 [Candidatus Colwellbacteria bacterium CG_4_9_14_0_2_um_filter_50_12]
MYDLFIQLVIMVALGTVVYLLAIASPRVQDDQHFEEHRVAGWVRKLPLERIDAFLAGYRDKILRRLKVWILKADNFVGRWLNNHKDGGAQG